MSEPRIYTQPLLLPSACVCAAGAGYGAAAAGSCPVISCPSVRRPSVSRPSVVCPLSVCLFVCLTDRLPACLSFGRRCASVNRRPPIRCPSVRSSAQSYVCIGTGLIARQGRMRCGGSCCCFRLSVRSLVGALLVGAHRARREGGSRGGSSSSFFSVRPSARSEVIL